MARLLSEFNTFTTIQQQKFTFVVFALQFYLQMLQYFSSGKIYFGGGNCERELSRCWREAKT